MVNVTCRAHAIHKVAKEIKTNFQYLNKRFKVQYHIYENNI